MIKSRKTVFIEIHSSRLKLRKLELKDINEVFELHTNQQVNKYVIREPLKQTDDAQKFIHKINKGISAHKWFYWGITLCNSPKLIGTICLWNFSDDLHCAEIGYELLPQYQKKGYMTEAIESIINFAFNSLNLSKIKAFTHKNNSASIKLLKKFGFTFLKSFEENYPELNKSAEMQIFELKTQLDKA